MLYDVVSEIKQLITKKIVDEGTLKSRIKTNEHFEGLSSTFMRKLGLNNIVITNLYNFSYMRTYNVSTIRL